MPVFTFSNNKTISFVPTESRESNIAHDRIIESDTTSVDNLRIAYSASPYPSKILVSALPTYNKIVNISVSLYGLQAVDLSNLTLILVSPDQKHNLILLNAIGDGKQSPVDITIADCGIIMPENNQLVDNTYKPTSYYPYLDPPPKSPDPPYNQPQPVGDATFTDAFISNRIQHLDGIWSIYLYASGKEISSFGITDGWSISFHTKF